MNALLNSRIFLGLLVLTVFSGAALAEVVTENSESSESQFPAGGRAAAVLELQRSGLAAGKVQPLSGEVAGRSYKRYLDSFNQPMPSPKRGGDEPVAATNNSASPTPDSR